MHANSTQLSKLTLVLELILLQDTRNQLACLCARMCCARYMKATM
jgi:hypothetical protein